MHSRIYQISSSPVQQEGLMTENKFDYHYFVGSVADYVYGDNDRDADIRDLRNCLNKTKTARFDNDSFVIFPDGKERYFAEGYKVFVAERKQLMKLGLREFSSDSTFAERIRKMNDAFCSEYDFYVYTDEEDVIPLDKFIRYALTDTRYYIGGVLGYHF